MASSDPYDLRMIRPHPILGVCGTRARAVAEAMAVVLTFVLTVGLSAATTPVALAAQGRTLSWPTIEVTAHLDRDGRLHVRERQTIRFNGEWNGGERRFAVGFGQEFEFDSIVHVDDGTAKPMFEGEIDRVDGYEMFSGNTLRWRSRLPEDPPFADDLRTYELHFTYGQILQPDAERTYQLAHDFAFADRDGEIDRFILHLTLDRAWGAPADFSGEYETTGLLPGNGFVVTVPLRRLAAEAPSGVRAGASTSTRYALLTVLVAGVAGLLVLLVLHDARRGRFAAVMPAREVTPEWLEKELFVHLPEVAGAAWDDSTSQAEVAATLARLVQEGKLASRVETRKILVFRRHILHLELKTERATLRTHERSLIDKLFTSGSNSTDTDRVRKRYESTGFDPSSAIRPGITKLVNAMAPGDSKDRPSRRVTLSLIGLAFVLIGIGVSRSGYDALIAVATVGASIPAYLVARGCAAVWKRRVTDLWFAGALGLLVIVAMVAVFGRTLIFNDTYRTGPLVLAGLVVWLLALVNSVGNGARTQQSSERIATRKRMVAARNFFRRELATPQPQLRDAWYPYMLAFGLGSHVDRWFKSFGAAATADAMSSSHRSSSAMNSSSSRFSNSSSSSFSGFGGGGGFSGGGGGAAFGAAIGGMAASVSAPSSSSSGGSSSSSSGGSSGGGGGGGW